MVSMLKDMNSSGNRLGNEFRINSYTNGNQDRVSLTQLVNGNVVAVWDSEGQDGDGDGIFAQILDVGASLNISTVEEVAPHLIVLTMPSIRANG